jgi:hypothetical protein
MFAVALALALAALMSPLPLAAQSGPGAPATELLGRVHRGPAPVAGAEVTLHRVSPSASGPVGRAVTDAGGQFRFALPATDTAAFVVFFATVEHQSVRYFGPPVHEREIGAGYAVEVFDTTSTVQPGVVRTARRDLVMIPQTDGGWTVNEIVRVHNAGDRTLVSADGMPTWEIRLPQGAVEFEAGEGDVAPDEVRLMGDRVLLVGALVPGERELFLRYRLPATARGTVLPVQAPVDSMNLFVRQPGPTVTATGMTSTKTLTVEGEQFVQYGAANLPAGTDVRLRWESAGAAPVDPVWAGLAVTVMVLAVGTVAALRRESGRGDRVDVPRS